MPRQLPRLALVAFSLFVTAIVFACATISNDNLQDLKTGQLVGASPMRQQIALIVGVAAGAAVRDALRRANVPAASIDLLISASGVQEQALPNTATAQELFNTCVANGGAKWDHSGMVKALERMANHDVAK